MISAISLAGLPRVRLFAGLFTGAVFIDLLRRLVRDLAGRKVHLIVDAPSLDRLGPVLGRRIEATLPRGARQ